MGRKIDAKWEVNELGMMVLVVVSECRGGGQGRRKTEGDGCVCALFPPFLIIQQTIQNSVESSPQ